MTTKIEITRALERVAKGDTLDAAQPEFCKSVLLASFSRFSDQVAPDAPSSAAALNGVAVLRHKCAVGENAYIEPLWVGARLVGVAKDEPIVVDTLAAATMVLGAGGIARRASAHPAGYVLTRASLTGTLALEPGTRAAIVREADEDPSDAAISGGGRIATVTLSGAYCVDLYEGGRESGPRQIEIARINRTAGDALDQVPPRHDGVRRRPKNAGRAVTIDYAHPPGRDMESVNDIYDGYMPEAALCALAKPHPAPLIQSKTLAGARPVPQSYRPVLDPQVLTSGAISDCQFETLVLAGEAHGKRLAFDEHLGGEPRMGFYIADGTGAGKSNSGVGIILDNWNQGRRRHIIVGEKQRHREGYAKAMQMLGMSTDLLFGLDDYRGNAPLPNRDGVLFLTYSLLRQMDGNNRFQRVRQIIEWAGPNFEGVLLMDESQNMRNGVIAVENGGWSSSASLQAMAGIDLQNRLLAARVVYSSATGSTLLENLSYMVRLGLWGPGTPYKTSDAFYDGINASGLSGLEAVSSHIKANGQMVCRQLSLRGVVYEELVHAMGPDDIRLYDAYCSMLFEVTRVAQYCAQNAVVADRRDPNARVIWRNLRPEADGANYASTFASLSKRLIDTLIVSIKCQTLIADMEKALARGEACVIQIQNTFEAELNRMLANGSGIDSTQLQATSELVRFVNALPEHKITSRSEPKLDKSRERIPVPENREAKQRLIEKILALPAFVRPLESLFGQFGHSRVAEITGRSNRVVPVDPLGLQGDPKGALEVQERNDAAVRADLRAFMNDQKQILVFSNDAGGTGNDYHASLFARNQRLRRHYVLQFGYRADQAIQGPGRSHRSNQRQPPVVVCVSLDIPAEKIYLSGVVSRMASLGALSQGHRQASSNGMFSALDTYRSKHAEHGWEAFASKLRASQYDDLNLDELAVIGSLDKAGSANGLLPMEAFMKRAAALPVEVQRRTFARLDYEIQNHIMSLISTGRYDSGPEMMRDPVTILSEEVIYTHPNTGARIKISRVECDVTANLRTFDQALGTAEMLAPAETQPTVWFNETTADIWIEYEVQAGASGFEMVGVIRPDHETCAPRFTMRGRRIEKVDDPARATMLWEAMVQRIAKHRVRDRIIISGALPLIWTMLQRHYRRLIVAKTKNDDRILGFTTNDQEIEQIRIRLAQMDMASVNEIDRVYDDFKAGLTINLGNGMIITPQMVSTVLRQTLNVADGGLERLRQNASPLGLEVVRFGTLEHFAFSADPQAQHKSLRSLLSAYGYADTTDLPDWSRLR